MTSKLVESNSKIKLTLATLTSPQWIFTDKEGVTPRYAPKSFDIENQINTFANNISAEDNNYKSALCPTRKHFLLSFFFESNTNTTDKIYIPKKKKKRNLTS